MHKRKITRGNMEELKQVVTSYAEALENAVRFHYYLKNNESIIHKLSQYTHWYYFPEKEIFAPSKFIGYKDNTYNSESAHQGDGRETEKALARFFRKLKPRHEQQDYFINELYKKLTHLLKQHNKNLKRNAVIHIPKDANL
jgi:5-methylcytosine-specific restriction protein A